jgi:hypothetical protein
VLASHILAPWNGERQKLIVSFKVMKNFPFIVEQGEENVNNYKQRTNKANMKIVGNVFQVIVRDGQITPTTHKIYLRSFFYILLPEQSILQRNQ